MLFLLLGIDTGFTKFKVISSCILQYSPQSFLMFSVVWFNVQCCPKLWCHCTLSLPLDPLTSGSLYGEILLEPNIWWKVVLGSSIFQMGILKVPIFELSMFKGICQNSASVSKLQKNLNPAILDMSSVGKWMSLFKFLVSSLESINSCSPPTFFSTVTRIERNLLVLLFS